MKVELREITGADIPAVATFLHENLNSRVSAATWASAVVPPWPADAPNHGYLLSAEGAVVGAMLAFYSERRIGGATERICNLGAWCVLPAYRLHSLRLLRAALGQKGYTFTDLSPSGDVPEINARLGFRDLDTTTAVVPNLPWPSLPGRTALVSDPAEIEKSLSGQGFGEQLRVFRDHAGAAAARHVVIRHRGEVCYVVFRRVRRRNLPLFASVLYASDPAVLARAFRTFTRHLLVRHGIPVTLVEAHVMPRRPAWSVRLGTPRRKMYKSSRLGPGQIDNLYSELVCVPW